MAYYYAQVAAAATAAVDAAEESMVVPSGKSCIGQQTLSTDFFRKVTNDCHNASDSDSYSTRDTPANDSMQSRVSSSWRCTKCHHDERKSDSRCSYCKGWRSGKRPKKNPTTETKSAAEADEEFLSSENSIVIQTSQEKDEYHYQSFEGRDRLTASITTNKSSSLLKAVASKPNLKPLYEINDKVYGPWWPDDNRDESPSWYSGVISNYVTVSHPKYGPIRMYDVVYDDDGEEVTEIEDYYVFGWDDYLLTLSGKEWVGVVNVLDEGCEDSWGEIVGWYNVCIDGEKFSFSRLVDALRAHDEHIIQTKGESVDPSELNLPDEIIHANSPNESTDDLTSPDQHVDYSLNYIGVSFHRQSKKYEAYVYYQKGSSTTGQKRGIGRYALAADAALARDVCCLQLDISAPQNFEQETNYIDARKKEMEERQITVASQEEVMVYLDDKVKSVVSEVACNDEDEMSEATSEEDFHLNDDNAEKSQDDHTSSTTLSKYQVNQKYALNYCGVSLNKGTGKFPSYVCISGDKVYSLGSYILAVDGAYARDKCLNQLALPFKQNFSNESDYSIARATELNERALDVPLEKEMTYMNSKVKTVVSKIKSKQKKDQSNDLIQDELKEESGSIYHGVSLPKTSSNGKYQAQIWHSSSFKSYYLGAYDLETDAAIAYDKAARLITDSSKQQKLNFADDKDYVDARRRESAERGMVIDRNEANAEIDDKVEKFRSKITKHASRMDAVTARIKFTPPKVAIARKADGSATPTYDAEAASDDQDKAPSSQFFSNTDNAQSSGKIGLDFTSNTKSRTDAKRPSTPPKQADAYARGQDLKAIPSIPRAIPRVGVLAGIAAKVGTHGKPETDGRTKEKTKSTNYKSLLAPSDQAQVTSKSDPDGASSRTIKSGQLPPPPSPTKSIFKNENPSHASIVTSASQKENSSTLNGGDMSKLILLTENQSAATAFPVNTRVWFVAESCLNEGSIAAVYCDTTSCDLLYTVTSKQQCDPIFRSAKEMSYAPSSAVFVSPCFSQPGTESAQEMVRKGASLLKGSVLLSKMIDTSDGATGWAYMVTIEHEHGIRILDNVPSRNITLRQP